MASLAYGTVVPYDEDELHDAYSDYFNDRHSDSSSSISSRDSLWTSSLKCYLTYRQAPPLRRYSSYFSTDVLSPFLLVPIHAYDDLHVGLSSSTLFYLQWFQHRSFLESSLYFPSVHDALLSFQAIVAHDRRISKRQAQRLRRQRKRSKSSIITIPVPDSCLMVVDSSQDIESFSG